MKMCKVVANVLLPMCSDTEDRAPKIIGKGMDYSLRSAGAKRNEA